MKFTSPILLTILFATLGLAACQNSDSAAATPTPDSQMRPSAGIQDIMKYMIDPAADFIWASTSITFTDTGMKQEQPETDAEWDAVTRQALILAEAANLIQMEGRHVVKAGGVLEDEGTPGNLTAAEAEQAIKDNRAAFNAYALALHDAGMALVQATKDRDAQALVEQGDTLDEVCESCHLEFWYPGQNIPAFKNQAPEVAE